MVVSMHWGSFLVGFLMTRAPLFGAHIGAYAVQLFCELVGGPWKAPEQEIRLLRGPYNQDMRAALRLLTLSRTGPL